MNWAEHIDLYCERTDASLWSEPLNALSNLGFLLVAVVLWKRVAGRGRDLQLLDGGIEILPQRAAAPSG